MLFCQHSSVRANKSMHIETDYSLGRAANHDNIHVHVEKPEAKPIARNTDIDPLVERKVRPLHAAPAFVS